MSGLFLKLLYYGVDMVVYVLQLNFSMGQPFYAFQWSESLYGIILHGALHGYSVQRILAVRGRITVQLVSGLIRLDLTDKENKMFLYVVN